MLKGPNFCKIKKFQSQKFHRSKFEKLQNKKKTQSVKFSKISRDQNETWIKKFQNEN